MPGFTVAERPSTGTRGAERQTDGAGRLRGRYRCEPSGAFIHPMVLQPGRGGDAPLRRSHATSLGMSGRGVGQSWTKRLSKRGDE